MYADTIPAPATSELRFWERSWLLALLLLLSAAPLFWPDIPGMVDLPGHMGRYRVQLEIDSSEALQRFYAFEWALIGNLGVDLLIIPLTKVMSLEAAVKLITILIPPLTAAGFLWVAREVHGRVPPTALFALPLAYNFPFLFGFLNFALSMALAFLGFALWLRLGRLGRTGVRAAIFPAISLLIWITHTFGWGTLGVMAFSAEVVRQYDKGRGFVMSPIRAGVHCLSLAPPFLLMLAWRSGHVGGTTGDWFNWEAKFRWFAMTLRDRWELFDTLSLALLMGLIAFACFSRQLGFSRNLVASALFLLLVYLVLPRVVFGSAYADMRLMPYLVAVAVIAIRPREGPSRLTQALGIAGLIFFLVRTAATGVSFWMYDRVYDRELQALNHVPHGARLISFVGHECRMSWAMSRVEHLPAIAIVRNRAFANDQWAMAGAQLLKVIHPAPGFRQDPSQLVVPWRCGGEVWRPVNAALAGFPRDRYDYVWMIQPPRHDPRLLRGLTPIWRDGTSVLYRVDDRAPPAV